MVRQPIQQSDQRPVIRTLVVVIEALRYKRREQWHNKLHPQGKRFTQEELRDEVYPSYKHLLQGQTQRLPTRTMLGHIADYLECSLSELNDILIAAQYVPERVELSETQQRLVLDQAHAILENLPLPAIVLTDDWTISAANLGFLRLYNLPSLSQLAVVQRNLLHLLFDPALPYRARHTPTPEQWYALAQQTVALFRQMNRFTLYEPMLQERLLSLQRLPDFLAIWTQTHPTGATLPPIVTITANSEGAIATYSYLAITSSGNICPGVLALVPGDIAARHIFAEADSRTMGNGWEWMRTLSSL